MTSRTKPSRPTRNPGLPDIDFSNDPPLEGLEPIGDLPIYGSPVEPVEPWDCDRWPSSPLCGGNPLSDKFIDLEPQISHNGCATCITITPVIGFLRLPALTYCYIRPECQVSNSLPPSFGCMSSENISDLAEDLKNRMLDGYIPTEDDLIPPCGDESPEIPFGNGDLVNIKVYWTGGGANVGWDSQFGDFSIPTSTNYLYQNVIAKNNFILVNTSESYSNKGVSSSSGYYSSSSYVNYFEFGGKTYQNSEGYQLHIPGSSMSASASVGYSGSYLEHASHSHSSYRAKIFINDVELLVAQTPPSLPSIPPSPNPPENMDCCAELRRLLKTVIIKQKELETREKVQFENLEDIRRAVGVKVFPVEVPGSYDWSENFPNVQLNTIPDLIRWTTNRLGELENKIARATGAHLMPVPVPARYDAATGTVEVNNLVDLIKWTTQKLADVENRTRKAVEGLEDSVGVNDFPVKVPELLLTDRGDKEIDIKSIPGLIVWFVKQFDALVGELPGKLEIEDTDLISEGNQSKLMTFPTLSDLLLEIAGVCINNKINTEAILTTVLNTMVEAGSTKTTAVANHHAIQAILDYLSPDLAQDKVKVPLSFTPGEAKLDKLLKPKEVEVKIVKVASETDLKDDIADLKKFASEWRAQNVRRIKINGTEVAQVLGFIKDAASALGGDEDIKGKGGKSDFSEFVEQVETGFISENGISDTTNPYGRPYNQRPKIREIGNTSDQGTE